VKIALAQINPTVGDVDGNCAQIVAAAKKAAAQGAQLTVFSEMCVIGYPARDLLEKPAFLAAQDRAMEKLCTDLRGIPAIVGFVQRRTGTGRALYNSCGLIENGKLEVVGHKCLLPTYDVFDEDRYFEGAEAPVTASFGGKKLGLSICEDCWNDKDYWSQRRYSFDPMEVLAASGAEIIINISASPFSIGKQAVRQSMLSAIARRYKRPLVYVNQVGGNDDLLFDGHSMAFDSKGHLLANGPAFEEAVTLVDVNGNAPQPSAQPTIMTVEEELHRGLVMGTRDYARKCGFKSAVLGLSGGIDSALVAALAAEAFGPKNVTGVALPSRFNAPESLGDAKDLAERLGINFHVVAIEDVFGATRQSLSEVFAGRQPDVTEENMEARIRGLLLMAMSNKFGSLLLTTGNKSELATGYCTLYGDMCGGLAVISDVYKTMVYRLSNHLNAINPDRPPIPQSSITKAPTAELRFNQKDQDTLPPYDMLDGILKAAVEDHRTCEEIVGMGYSPEVVKKVLRMVDFNEYKRRQAAPGLKVTIKAFGTGRRMPIAQRFRDF
jgi:NAD+ synthase/NAD+ synthase (glutamine-hydrolysing)